jgi:hypothetical protein
VVVKYLPAWFFSSIDYRLKRLEYYMSALRDYVDAVKTETTRNGESIKTIAKKLDDAIASGDPAALADLGTAVSELHAVGDSLAALATGSPTDPVPPPADASV